MNNTRSRKVSAKIMLAGEYGVIAGGAGLTIPFPAFSAEMTLPGDQDKKDPAVIKSNSVLQALLNYIHTLPEKTFIASPDLQKADTWIKQGAWISSDIPQGYGVGSSGAVSALFYDEFFTGAGKLSLSEQRRDLSAIESFFHGKSSGVDALSCFTGSPLLFAEDGSIEEITFRSDQIPGEYRLFLLDSGTIMETGPLVSWFLEQMKQSYFASPVKFDYLHITRLFIDTLLGRKEADAAMLFRALSDFHYTHFHKMIPPRMRDLWLEGQVSNDYYLKINGSGGGYLLGIVYEGLVETVNERLGRERIIWI